LKVPHEEWLEFVNAAKSLLLLRNTGRSIDQPVPPVTVAAFRICVCISVGRVALVGEAYQCDFSHKRLNQVATEPTIRK